MYYRGLGVTTFSVGRRVGYLVELTFDEIVKGINNQCTMRGSHLRWNAINADGKNSSTAALSFNYLCLAISS